MFIVAPENISGAVYLFDTRDEEEATLESDITDHWVEDNTARQDHIGLKPITISLSGYVGELTNKLPVPLQPLKSAETVLSGTNPFLPQLTTQTQYILNRAQEVYGIYEKANETVSRLEDKLRGIEVPQSATKQEAIFMKFFDMWKSRTTSTIYTPFGAFESMAITNVTATQTGDTVYMSSFKIKFKQIRIVGESWVWNDPERARKVTETLTTQVDKGITKPKAESLQSTLDSMYQTGRGWVQTKLGWPL